MENSSPLRGRPQRPRLVKAGTYAVAARGVTGGASTRWPRILLELDIKRTALARKQERATIGVRASGGLSRRAKSLPERLAGSHVSVNLVLRFQACRIQRPDREIERSLRMRMNGGRFWKLIRGGRFRLIFSHAA
jgi:hypothetical protein